MGQKGMEKDRIVGKNIIEGRRTDGDGRRMFENKFYVTCALVIQTIINKMWFCNKDNEGVIHPEFSEGGLLSIYTIALAFTVVTILISILYI